MYKMRPTAKPILPPSLKTDLFGGHFRSFRRDAPAFLTRLAQLGDITSFRMGPIQGYFVNDPELVRDVLVVNAHKFKKGRALQRAKSLLGNGLLTNEGEAHLRQRRMIQPAFHKARIAEYARTMTEYAAKMSATWNDGEVRDIDKEMMHLTLQIVAKTLFSANVDDEADEIGGAMTAMVEMFNYLLLPFSEWLQKLPLPQSRRFARARDTLDRVIYRIINEHRASGRDTGDLLSMLLHAQDEDDGTTMTDEQVRDEALTLFLAGHETTANALTWTWYLLSQNSEKEAALHAELNTVLAGRTPTFEDIPRLKYTEAVLAESMRLFPPAWAIGRLSLKEHELGGYHLPENSLVLLSPYIAHRDARYWNEADKFVPERWGIQSVRTQSDSDGGSQDPRSLPFPVLTERQTQSVKEASQRYIYFPFGGGARRCIGEGFAWTEGILLLATLAQKWKLGLLPDQKIGLSAMITLRPKYGMRMQCQNRER
jgi:cytochrome P450